jgi:hypothetical protein
VRVAVVTLGLALALPPVAACGFDPSGSGGPGGGGRDDGGGGGGTDGGAPTDGGGGPDGAPPDAGVDPTARVSCPKTDELPNSDAQRLGPWLEVPFVTFAVTDAELVADEHASYEKDAVVEFACLHDAFNVYFFFDVKDAAVQDDSVSLRQDDAIVFFLDGAGDLSGTYGADDHAAVVTSAGDGMDYAAGTENDLSGDAVADTVEGGYRIEVEVDKTSIHDPLPGTLGFNLAIVDDDGWGDNLRDVFALRHVPDDQVANACEDCCEGEAAPWCDTRLLGELTLE